MALRSAGARTGIVVVLAVLALCGALTTALLQVRVHAGTVGASCGSPFDVVSGRADWQAWYAHDLADPRLDARAPLVRTDTCPRAVNHRTTIAGVLATVGAAMLAVAVVTGPRRRRDRQYAPLRVLGIAVSAVGVALVVGGIAGLVVLVANPQRALFLYVDRWVVLLVGLVVLAPAVGLAVGGRALVLLADARAHRGHDVA